MIDLRHNINGGGNAPPTFWRNKMQQGTNKTNRDRFVTSYGKDANYSHNDNRRCAIWFEKKFDYRVYTRSNRVAKTFSKRAERRLAKSQLIGTIA
tara:strand:- start:81 stop:365 length:285 start_codon:yes stop_codon:yes gene_type:complete